MTQPVYTPARYTGTNSTDTYSFGFHIFQDADLTIVKTDLSGVESTLILGSDYTVTGAGSYSGGSITLTAGNLPTGYGLVIYRIVEITQETSVRDQGAYRPEVIEDTFDRLVMQNGQQQEQIERALLGGLSIAADVIPGVDAILKADFADSSTGKGAQLIAYKAPYTGAPATTVDARLRLLSTIQPTTANGDNTFVGYAGNLTLGPSGGAATLASQNTGVGKSALVALTTGYENTAVGVSAMAANTTGQRNTAVGVTALAANLDGHHNIAFGQNALLSNTSGTYNTAIGIDCLHDNTTGYYNVGLGQNALLTCIDGIYNTALGIDALKVLTSGHRNVCVGNTSGYAITTGYYNTAVGTGSLHACINHVANTAIGCYAGYSNDGNYNVFLGYQAGYYETGSNTLIIDNQQRSSEADARVKALIYGIFATTAVAQRLVFNANLGFNGLTRKLAKVFADNAGGATYSYPADTSYVYLTSPNTTATTITLPATNGSYPIDGAEITFVCGSNITTVTWAAGAGSATIVGAPASITANVPVRMIYHAAGGKWYPA